MGCLEAIMKRMLRAMLFLIAAGVVGWLLGQTIVLALMAYEAVRRLLGN